MTYRPEIDGLRALAVLPVILFHAGIEAFEGGFVGVDVFFVISGYLITSIILAEMKSGRFTLASFYERRARRILPALTVVTLATIPAAWLLMLPHQFDDFRKSVIGVAIFASNFQFWWEAGYFDGAAELKPLLHTWSLAVEEQFYLLFPLLLLAIAGWARRSQTLVVAALGVASLLLCELTRPAAPDAVFFLAPFRIWELLVGAVAVLLTAGVAQKGRDVPGLVGVAMIAAAVFVFDDASPAPGIVSLLPVLGTALVLVYARDGTLAARALSIGPLVSIGLLSYSAYLWHQPLFAFARLAQTGSPSLPIMLILSVLSIGLGWLSWRFVEQPFRHGGATRDWPRRTIFLSSGAAALALIVMGSTFNNASFVGSRLSASASTLLSYAEFSETEEFDRIYRRPSCYFDPRQIDLSEIDRVTCHEPVAGRPNVLLLGDSHGAHLWHGFTQVFPEVHFLQANAAGCRPLLPVEGTAACTALLEHVWREVLPNDAIDAVILAGRWIEDDVDRLAGTIAELHQAGLSVLVAGPVPEYQAALPVILSRTGTGADRDALASRYLDQDRFVLAEAIKRETLATGATYLDLVDALCDDGTCQTLATDGVPLQWDDSHFTPAGSVAAVSGLAGQFDGFDR